MEQKIERFLAELPEPKKALAVIVRDIMLKADSSITEDIKWGNLTFISNGNVAFVYTYKSVPYINLGFMRAVELTDPEGLLEGTGKGMRHIKIASEKDIDKKQITSWAKEAVKLNAMNKPAKAAAKKTPAKKAGAKKTSSKTSVKKGSSKKAPAKKSPRKN